MENTNLNCTHLLTSTSVNGDKRKLCIDILLTILGNTSTDINPNFSDLTILTGQVITSVDRIYAAFPEEE